MYIFYLPKVKGESVQSRNVNSVIKNFYQNIGKNSALICSPGYLSNKDNTIIDFFNNLSNLINRHTLDRNIYIGILPGINGDQILPSNKTILNRHITNMSQYGFKSIHLLANGKSDHRKVICFFEVNPRFNLDNIKINRTNCITLINNIQVNAVLAGSSNFSNTTYFENNATKGETDIFLLKRKYTRFKENIKIDSGDLENKVRSITEGCENVIISKSIYDYNIYEEKFFNDILENMLNYALR